MNQIIWHYKTFEELTNKELYQLLQLRNEVFIVEQDCPYQDMDDKDFKSIHLFGVLDGVMVACARIVPPEVSYKEPSFGRIVTKHTVRGKRVGDAMMHLIIQIIENHYETSSVRISAQCYLDKFYGKFGFEQVSEEYLEDNLPHMEMLRK